ncbi:hypothetical protein Fot_42747 [Forsythia ovata]|uniref:Uncharacterized protein n=1 Tax=Forsythia ovata TaxID=205694 RepID=A0ABD1RM27_9LAMI
MAGSIPTLLSTVHIFIPNSSYWTECINIGSCQDELDPTILEKLSYSSAMVAASVYKYWTSVWARVKESADLLQLMKIAEMNIARSHVLNCKLYKVFAMKVDELRSKVVGAKDIDALHSENKALCVQFVPAEDARAQAVYDVTKSGTIQRMCTQAQKKTESQLRSS